MKNRLLLSMGAAIIGCALTSPAVLSAQDHDDHHDQDHRREYHDEHHHDDHRWNDHEDRAYHIWLEQRHHRYIGFDQLSARDQQRYWDWRHNHDDSLLQINIR